jgi:monofunctional biosynthetic peptidoglycan transglycosylase
MARAVIASEDNLFDKHSGFDWKAIKQAQKEYESGKRRRGGSTISQQTAKNVFLLPHRSMVRKGFEAYFTVLIEFLWSKERIMEVYLNVAEMGKGIFGVEAAAEHHFGTSAAKLTRRQSCLIAACLPNPQKRNAGKPSSYISRRAGDIAALESKIGYPDWVYHK